MRTSVTQMPDKSFPFLITWNLSGRYKNAKIGAWFANISFSVMSILQFQFPTELGSKAKIVEY